MRSILSQVRSPYTFLFNLNICRLCVFMNEKRLVYITYQTNLYQLYSGESPCGLIGVGLFVHSVL